ncbi:hypothetical protein EI77_04106 [Prosthecobacter fusiformis]|uniref:Uncharacterized protein n=2 Tax=Prosthecobacter fusiformis TaxID=48464 RepID=A0A4R7RLX0_9BACT|nr:hypothetical protein EI77_04106 [Prosthecobacter fusiformis]
MAQGPRPRPGQEETTVTIPNPAVSLTEAQVTTVLTQLKELEGQILEMRGSTLSTVMARLRQGMASDQAAMNLYLECDKIVNSERKEADKSEARKRQEDIEKKMDRRPKGGGGAPEETGDFGFAVKLGLQYLILTLEAHEAKDEDFNKMIPKLQEYIQTVVAAAPKLKGRASGYLNNALSPSNPIVDAFSLSRYLNRKEWSTRPMDIGSMYTQTLLPLAEQENKELLPGLWDARITAEGVFRKENMFAPEFELWTRNELPTMRWQRAMYLYQKGPSPINALADMLKVIKENQSHADAPKWVTELRQLVNHSAPTQKSENLDSASSSEQ